jgi:uncharacterized membrane protein
VTMRYTAMLILAFAVGNQASASSITLLPASAQGFRMMLDGRTLIGIVDEGNEIRRWTRQGGLEVLGALDPNILITGFSGDGRTLVGRRVSTYSQEAIRWNVDEGLTVLPTTPGFPHNSSPTQVSYDGSIIYGTAYTEFTAPIWDLFILGLISNIDFDDFISGTNREAVIRWQNASAPQILTDLNRDLPAPAYGSVVAADGKSAAGIFNRAPAIWSETTGMVRATILPDNFDVAYVEALSADGSTAIGRFFELPFSGARAFRWVKGEPFQPLTDTSEYYSDAIAVSADGKTILGRYEQEYNGLSYTYIWTEDSGLQSLADYFTERGIDLPHADFHNAYEMSSDGLVFHGNSITKIMTPDGSTSYPTISWLVDFRVTVPEPTSLECLFCGMLCLVRRRNNFRKSTGVAKRT